MIAARTEGHFSCFVYVVQNETSFWTRARDRRRPYRDEYTGSLPNSEVNRRRARSVLGWGTAWEDLRVLLALFSFCRPFRGAPRGGSGTGVWRRLPKGKPQRGWAETPKPGKGPGKPQKGQEKGWAETPKTASPKPGKGPKPQPHCPDLWVKVG